MSWYKYANLAMVCLLVDAFILVVQHSLLGGAILAACMVAETIEYFTP